MTKKRVILHCGAPKTATTSIQAACLTQLDALRSEGILYPAVRRESPETEDTSNKAFRNAIFSNEDEVPTGFAGHNFAFAGFRSRKPKEGKFKHSIDHMNNERAEVLKEFRDSGAHTLIFSSENTFFRANKLELDRLRDELGDDIDVTVAMALRHPVDLLNSLYSTRVVGRSRTREPASEYGIVGKYHALGGYQGIVDSLRSSVRADRVIPFLMSDLFKSGHSLLGNFFHILGVESSIEKDYHARPTPQPEAVMFLLRMNQAQLPNIAFYECLKLLSKPDAPKGPLQEAGVKPSFFATDVQEALDARYQQDIAWLTAECGMDASGDKPFKLRPVLEGNAAETDQAFADALAPQMDERLSSQLVRAMASAQDLPKGGKKDARAERAAARRRGARKEKAKNPADRDAAARRKARRAKRAAKKDG